MKRIVFDFLRRWKWIYLNICGLQVVHTLTEPESSQVLSLAGMIYCGIVPLSFDLTKGTTRIWQALPVARRDLANSWRFLGVMVPIILFAVNLVW